MNSSSSLRILSIIAIGAMLLMPAGLALAQAPGTNGTPGDDLLIGSNKKDRIHGNAGDDVIFGRGGNDVLTGGTDNDEIFGEKGNDTLQGGDDNDYLDGGIGNDDLQGGAGNDILSLGAGDDLGRGGAGNDDMDGGTGDDDMGGQDGNDFMTGGPGDDIMTGGTGNDVVEGGIGNDTLVSGINGTYNYLSGGPGDDVLTGSIDTLTSSNPIVIIDGGEGDEIIGDICFFDGGPGFINFPGLATEFEGNDIIVGGINPNSTCESIIVISTGVDLLGGPTNLPPLLTITSPANGADVLPGVTLSGTAIDDNDGDISASIDWSSVTEAAATVLGTGASITPGLAVDTHTITATVTDTDANEVSVSISINVIVPTVPDAPTLDTATAASDSVVDLEFTANGDGASPITGFTMYASADGTFTDVAPQASAGSPDTFTGLDPATLYTFKVTATNAIGESLDSNTRTATTQSLISDSFAISDDNFVTETDTFELGVAFTMYLRITTDEDVHSALVDFDHIKKAECEVAIGNQKIRANDCKLTEVSPGVFEGTLDSNTILSKFPNGGAALVKILVEDDHRNKLEFAGIEVTFNAP